MSSYDNDGYMLRKSVTHIFFMFVCTRIWIFTRNGKTRSLRFEVKDKSCQMMKRYKKLNSIKYDLFTMFK